MMIRRICSDKFVKNNIIFFIGSMITSVLAYFFQLVLGRMLNISAFGEVQALLSLLGLLGVVLGIYKIIVVHIVSNAQDIQKKQEIIAMLKKSGLILAFIMVFFIVAFSAYLEDFLHFHSSYSFFCLAFLLVLGLLSNFRGAILQGRHDFMSVSVFGIITSSSRLVFGAFLVYLGYSVFGAMTALVIAEASGLVYVYWMTRGALSPFMSKKIRFDNAFKNELKYGLLVLAVTLCVNFFYSADILLVKHYFSPNEAGLYGGVAMISRIVLFVTGSITGVLLPSVKMDDKENNNKNILLKAGSLLFLMGGFTLLVFSFFPDWVISLMMGARYQTHANLLPRLSILMFFISLNNLFFVYYMALRKYFLLFFTLMGPLTIITLSYFRHSSLSQIIDNFLFVNIFTVVCLLLKMSGRYIFCRRSLAH